MRRNGRQELTKKKERERVIGKYMNSSRERTVE